MPPVTLVVPVLTWPPAPPWALVELPPVPPAPGPLPAPLSFQTDMIELESPEQPANTSQPVTKIEARKRMIHLQILWSALRVCAPSMILSNHAQRAPAGAVMLIP
jgi:hypothetical protein